MTQRNEGEGNKTAARRYNEETRKFADSGQVKPSAEEARKALDGAEGDKLRRAEATAKKHAKDEDPHVRGSRK